MEFEVKYNKSVIKFELNTNNYMGTLSEKSHKKTRKETEILQESINNPIDSESLEHIVKQGERIAIVTSDISRPMPSYKVLPLVIAKLVMAGIKEQDIMVVLALGSHRSHSEQEKRQLVGDSVYDSDVEIVDSDMDQCERLGMCRNGTPADVFKPVTLADRVICLGNIEYHYFAGYSGGAKAIMPGVSSFEAIQANHKNMIHKEAYASNLETNPVRQDIDQVPEFLNIDFIVNVVLNQKKEIIGAFSGHWKSAHRSGCAFLDEIYGVEIEGLADVVIVSPGGFPKDLNLYQAQKGLDNSRHAVREGGTILMCACAEEGFGEHTFETWMKTKSPKERIESIQNKFKLGGHKAAAIGRIQEKYQVILVSDMPRGLVEQIGFTYASDMDQALSLAFETQGMDAKVLLMPSAGSTLPLFKSS